MPSRRALAAVFATAVVAQSWILFLPFRQDDYLLLAEPARLFREYAAIARADEETTSFFRPTLWAWWTLVRAVAGEPLRPAWFHVGALAAHGACAVLLARATARVASAKAGVLAGVGFAISSGAVQAVSWPAAGADLLMTLFGLLALGSFLDQRRLRGGAWLLLALASKAQALLLAPAFLLLLALLRRGRWRRDAPFVLAAAVAATAARWAYLGHARFGYGDVGPPGLLELPGVAGKALLVLGQALFPWNRDPLWADVTPFIARLLSLVSDATWIGIVPAALVVLAVFAARPRATLVALALAVFLALPAALLFDGPGSNAQARTAYLALAPLFAGLGIGLALLPRRRALVLSGCIGLLLLDGGVHLARTELRAGEHVRDVQSAVRGDSDVLLHVPSWSHGGVVTLTPASLRASLGEPFARGDAPTIESFRSEAELRFRLDELHPRDVRVLKADADGRLRPVAPGAPDDSIEVGMFPDRALVLDPSGKPPVFLITPREAQAPPAFVRLELVLRPPERRFPLYADFDLRRPIFGVVLFRLELRAVHLQGDAPVPVPAAEQLSWETVLRQHVLPELDARGVKAGEVAWRVRLFDEDGLETGRSRPATARYEVAP